MSENLMDDENEWLEEQKRREEEERKKRARSGKFTSNLDEESSNNRKSNDSTAAAFKKIATQEQALRAESQQNRNARNIMLEKDNKLANDYNELVKQYNLSKQQSPPGQGGDEAILKNMQKIAMERSQLGDQLKANDSTQDNIYKREMEVSNNKVALNEKVAEKNKNLTPKTKPSAPSPNSVSNNLIEKLKNVTSALAAQQKEAKGAEATANTTDSSKKELTTSFNKFTTQAKQDNLEEKKQAKISESKKEPSSKPKPSPTLRPGKKH